MLRRDILIGSHFVRRPAGSNYLSSPTQTVEETVAALDYLRQLFAARSTVHSPVGLDPQAYGVTLQPLPPGRFAKNDVGFTDPTGTDHDALGAGLKKALYNYMHGLGAGRRRQRLVRFQGAEDARAAAVHRPRAGLN